MSIRGGTRSELPTWAATWFESHGAPKRRPLLARTHRAMRVLLVDDSDADRVRFGRALSGAGYEAHSAEDGSQAWERLQEQDFDVLVSDRQMPVTAGVPSNASSLRAAISGCGRVWAPRGDKSGKAAW